MLDLLPETAAVEDGELVLGGVRASALAEEFGTPVVVHDEFASFFPVPYDAEAILAAAGETLLVCSPDDPYAPGGAAASYFGLPTHELPDAGHVNTDAGYGPWPGVEEWALSQT